MKAIWSSDCGGGGGRVKFAGTKKRSPDGKDINTLAALAMSKSLKMNKKSKAKAADDSNLDNGSEYFSFKNSRSERDPTQNENMAARGV